MLTAALAAPSAARAQPQQASSSLPPGELQVTASSNGCGAFFVAGAVSPSMSSSGPPCPPGQFFLNDSGATATGYAQNIAYETFAPAGITIDSASLTALDSASNDGWSSASFWSGGGYDAWPNSGNENISDTVDGSYWGFELLCSSPSGCAAGQGSHTVAPASLTLIGTDTEIPIFLPIFSQSTPNLWYQGSQYSSTEYVWNPKGDAWPFAFSASDPSGICNMSMTVNNVLLEGPNSAPDHSSWQQCADPATWNTSNGAFIDTATYVPAAGSLALTMSATSAAQRTNTDSETVLVDNDPVGLSLTTPNDSDPNLWVNHPVTVNASATTGPSGLGGITCQVDGTPEDYPATGITVGDGVHQISCTAWNRAVDPQWQHNTAQASTTVRIDTVPPTLTFEPQNPADPAQLVVDTSDSESGVAGGSIQMAPAGTSSWTNLTTSFDGQHLIAQVPDAGLSGGYVFRASACDNVGNCASTDQLLTLPLRMHAILAVGFTSIDAPARVVTERVLVGWHYALRRRHHHLLRVRTGGHHMTVRLVIRRGRPCAHARIRTGPHRWRELTACRTVRVTLQTRELVPHGRGASVHGVLVSIAGVPVPGAAVAVQSAPDNGLGSFTTVAVVTTDAGGGWTANLPPGPSRLIRAVYLGSPTLLPASGQATVTVPAQITLHVHPRAIPWSGTITIRGRLLGGYVPVDGVALRLLVRYPGNAQSTPLLAFRSDAAGRFAIRWSYRAGHGIATYPFSVATTATESDYPFAAGESPAIEVTFGTGTTPGGPRHRTRHARA